MGMSEDALLLLCYPRGAVHVVDPQMSVLRHWLQRLMDDLVRPLTWTAAPRANPQRLRTYYHVTERAAVADIRRHGFLPGGGSCGRGTYLFREIWLAHDWIDGHANVYRDPVVLIVTTREKVPSVVDLCGADLDADEREQLHGHFIYPHAKDTRWVPTSVILHPDDAERQNPGRQATAVVVTPAARAQLGEARIARVLAAAQAERDRVLARRGHCAGWCDIVSAAIIDALAAEGFEGRIGLGRMRLPSGRAPWHNWALIEGVLVDATSDQFNRRDAALFPAVLIALPAEVPSYEIERTTITPRQAMRGLVPR